MKKSITALVAATGLVAISGPAFGQAASDQVQRQCRRLADNYARSLMAAKKAKVKDLEASITRPSQSWQEAVAHYMAQAANRSDTMTESELASLGTSYCVSRRPTDTK